MSSGLLSYQQAAAELGVSTRTLRRWKRERRLRVVELSPRKHWIRKEEIERLLAEREGRMNGSTNPSGKDLA